MRPHEEPHSNNLEDHFNCVDYQEDEVDLVSHGGHALDFLVNSKEETVGKDDNQDYPIEPGIDGHHLDDLVSKRISHRQATQRNSCVVLLLRVFAAPFEVGTRVIRECILD